MGLLQKEIQMVEKSKHNKTNNVEIKPLKGYDAIRETLD